MGRSFFFKKRTSFYHRNGAWTAVFTLFDPAYGQSWLVWYCDLQEEIHSWPLNEVGLNCVGPIIHGLFSINIIPVFSFHRSLNVGKHLCSIKDLNVCVCSVTQSCQTHCDLRDCSLPGSSVHRVFQARILEWVAISYSRGTFLNQGSILSLLHLLHLQAGSLPLSHSRSPKITVCVCVCVCLYVSRTVMSDSMWPPWTVACQALLSMEFSRQEYWSELPFPFPGDLLQADSSPSEPPGKPIKINICRIKRTRAWVLILSKMFQLPVFGWVIYQFLFIFLSR